MKTHQSSRKINSKPTIRQHVTSDQNIVWRVQEETHHIHLNIGRGKEQPDPVLVDLDGLTSGIANLPFTDWIEAEFADQFRAEPGLSGARVDLSEYSHHPRSFEGNGRDANFDRWPIFEKFVDLLSNSDLGPRGFFIICHRDSEPCSNG